MIPARRSFEPVVPVKATLESNKPEVKGLSPFAGFIVRILRYALGAWASPKCVVRRICNLKDTAGPPLSWPCLQPMRVGSRPLQDQGRASNGAWAVFAEVSPAAVTAVGSPGKTFCGTVTVAVKAPEPSAVTWVTSAACT